MAEADFPEDFNAAHEETNAALQELDQRAAEPVAEPEPEAQAEPEAAEEEQVSTTDTKEEPKEEPKDRIPVEQFKGMLDEREKRQAAERKLEELERQLASQKEPEPLVDPLEDGEKYADQIQKRAAEQVNEVNARMYQIQRSVMRKLHGDWDEAEAWFNENVGSNVAMQAAAQNAEDPFDSVYKMWTDHKTLQAAEGVDVSGLQARIAELEAQIEGKQAAKAEANAAAQAKPSLASTGTGTGVESRGQVSLEDLFGVDFNSRPQ